MYKSQKSILPETIGEFHLPAEKIHSYQTRSAVSGNVFLFRYDLSFTLKSVAFCGATLWDEIPVSMKKEEPLDSFKDKHKAW